jgi:hypothetical protein
MLQLTQSLFKRRISNQLISDRNHNGIVNNKPEILYTQSEVDNLLKDKKVTVQVNEINEEKK